MVGALTITCRNIETKGHIMSRIAMSFNEFVQKNQGVFYGMSFSFVFSLYRYGYGKSTMRRKSDNSIADKQFEAFFRNKGFVEIMSQGFTAPFFLSPSEDICPVLAYNTDENCFLHGEPSEVNKLIEELNTVETISSKIILHDLTTINHQDGNPFYTVQEFEKNLIDEYNPLLYPYFDFNIDSYVQEFMQSRENVLVLIGEKGTGKTSFLRNVIKRVYNNKDTITTCSSMSVFESPHFGKILKSKTRGVYIFEDADKILIPRTEGNSLMSDLLNYSDGLVPSRVKIIISTNLSNIGKVDTAILRPGRCFGVLKFKPLTREQAVTALRSLGRKVPDFGDSKDMTLSDALNFKGHEDYEMRKSKTGF
jgi:hypothetical protein